MLPLKIIATGIATPTCKVTSAQLDTQLGLPSGTVEAQSGVASRQYAPDTQLQSELAALAVQDAISRANVPTDSVDLLLSVSGVTQQAMPSMAAAIAQHLNLEPGTPAFDLNASCIGFLTGLQVAASLLNTRQYSRIALVASDLASRGVNWDSPESSLIFGDGAAATILELGDGTTGIRAFKIETYPEGFNHCEVRAGGTRRNPRVGDEPLDYLFRMDGKAVFRLALKTLPAMLERVLQDAQVLLPEINAIIPHQASHLGMAHVTKRLGFSEDKVINIYATHGNQVSASIPTALHYAFENGFLKPGHKTLIMGTAAGFTLGAAVLEV